MPDNLGDPIPRNEPFVVPASPEETFDSVWLRSINIFVPNTAEADPTQGSINIECLPYDSENTKVLSIFWISIFSNFCLAIITNKVPGN